MFSLIVHYVEYRRQAALAAAAKAPAPSAAAEAPRAELRLAA